MISKYIKELLENQNRVIVPDLGAFLHKSDSQKVIYFNEFLRFNDGLLLNHIAEQKKIDPIEAAKQLKAFVDETTTTLQARKQVVLEGIGSLYLDNNEKIQLKAEELIAYPIEEPVKETPTKPEESSLLAGDKDLLIIDNKNEDIPSDLIAPSETKPSAPIPSREKPSIENNLPPVRSQATSNPAPKPISKPAPKKPAGFVPAKKSKSNGNVLWIVGLLVVAIIAILYFFVLRPLYNNSAVNQNKVTTSDTIKKETTLQPVKDPVKIAPTETIAKTGKNYYLVIGCFVQEDNANKLIAQLKSEGFQPEKFAKIEEMYFVSIASFADKMAADKKLNELKSKGYTEVWIKYY
jgi:cell division septation protein DedD